MIYWNDARSVSIIQEALAQGRIMLASGDTVLGLWGQLTQPSFQALGDIKGRSKKPYLIVIGSAAKIAEFTDQPLSDKIKTLIATCWPGPVTLIFKAKSSLPDYIKSPDGTIALRVPDHEGLLELLQHFDGLFSTSANIHGAAIAQSIESVSPSILSRVGVICMDRGHQLHSQSPSTILDCSTGDIKVVRSGAFSVELLSDLIG